MPTQIDNNGTPTGPHVVLNIGYDNMQRETSLSATVAGTLDLLNNYTFNADSQVTQMTQQGQTGGNTVAAKLVNFALDSRSGILPLRRCQPRSHSKFDSPRWQSDESGWKPLLPLRIRATEMPCRFWANRDLSQAGKPDLRRSGFPA